MSAETVLVVDDDPVFRNRLGRAFADRGFTVLLASDGQEALTHARAQPIQFATVDLRIPESESDGIRSGLDVVERLFGLHPHIRMAMLTGYGSIATAVDATRRGAVTYLQKPVNADEILQALRGDASPADPPADPPSLDRVEWEHIQRVLQDCGGNISEAARRLGLHRRSLQRKLQRPPPLR